MNIWKLKSYGTYFIYYKDKDGKQRKINTRQTNLEDARKVADASGIKEIEMAGTAMRLGCSAMSVINTGRVVTVRKAFEEWPAYLRARNLSPSTIESYVRASIHRFIDAHGHLIPALITVQHVHAWVQTLTGKLNTRNHNFAALSSFLSSMSRAMLPVMRCFFTSSLANEMSAER